MKRPVPISAALQEIAQSGIKEEKRLPPKYGEWFHLLLYLSWHGWNVANQGVSSLPRDFLKGIEEVKLNLGITDTEIAEHFVSTDYDEMLKVMVSFKKGKYPEDGRMIEAVEFTPTGSLRVYSR